MSSVTQQIWVMGPVAMVTDDKSSCGQDLT